MIHPVSPHGQIIRRVVEGTEPTWRKDISGQMKGLADEIKHISQLLDQQMTIGDDVRRILSDYSLRAATATAATETEAVGVVNGSERAAADDEVAALRVQLRGLQEEHDRLLV